MKDKHFVLAMMALLVVIVAMLLVAPSICECNPGHGIFSGMHRIIFGPGPAHIAGTSPSNASSSASFSPESGPVGTMVTIHGSGFGASNTVEINGLVSAALKNIASSDGATLSFTIPQNLGPDCAPTQACPQFLMLVTPRAYQISVVTGSTTQIIGNFTVTAG